MLRALVLSFLLGAASGVVDLSDYCNMDIKNTPCQHCTVNRRCGSFDLVYVPLKDDEKELILEEHNKIRDAVAAGKHVDKNIRQASDMQAMSWDKEVEFVTSCHIKQCFWGHDEKRLTVDGAALGQNLYKSSSMVHKYRLKHHLKEAVKVWFEEYRHLSEDNAKYIYPSFKTFQPISRLAQLIWGESNLLGCCYKHFQKDKEYFYFVFCNYKPKGNVQKRKIYTSGEPNCSTFNDEFKHLCGDIRQLEDDLYVIPYGTGVSIYGSFSLGLALLCSVAVAALI